MLQITWCEGKCDRAGEARSFLSMIFLTTLIGDIDLKHMLQITWCEGKCDRAGEARSFLSMIFLTT
jgi:hypothetical protein